MHILQCAFVRRAMQPLSGAVQREKGEVYSWTGLVIAREHGVRYNGSFTVPLLMSRCDVHLVALTAHRQ